MRKKLRSKVMIMTTNKKSSKTGRKRRKKRKTPVTKVIAEEECLDETCQIHGPANRGENLDDIHEDYADELFNTFLDEEEETEPIEPITDIIPRTIYIADRCLQLGYKIGSETKKQGKKALEVGGFFLINKDDDTFSFRDFIIPKDLPVSSRDIRIAEHYDQVARENRALNKENGTEYRLGAMFHIHPFGSNRNKEASLYHSIDDDESLKSLVNKMAKTSRRIIESPYALIEDKIRKEYGEDQLCLKGDALSDAVKRFIYPDDEMFFNLLDEFGLKPNGNGFKKADFLARLLEQIDERTYEPRLVHTAVSFVFNNAKGGPYIKMGIEEKFKLTGKVNYATVDTNDENGLHLIVRNKGIDIPTKEEVAALVKERVKFPPKQKVVAKVAGALRGDGMHGTHVSNVPSGVRNWQDENYIYQEGIYSGNYPIHQHPRTLQESLDSLVLPEPPVEEDNSLLEALNEGGSVTKASTRLPNDQEMKIRIESSLEYEEIAQRFVYSLAAYIVEARSVGCKYSTYAWFLLDKMSTYVNRYAARPRTDPLLFGVSSSVLRVGDLIPDNEFVVKKHKMPGAYRLDDAISNAIHELIYIGDADEFTWQFMDSFAQASTEGRNKLLENYVPIVIEAYKRIRDNTPIGSSGTSDRNDIDEH